MYKEQRQETILQYIYEKKEASAWCIKRNN